MPFTPPFHSLFGVHTVLPVPDRGVAFVNSEDTSYGKGAAHYAGVVDIRAPERPELVSLFPEPIPPEGAPYRSFSERPGWSGPHNVNQLQHNPAVQRQGNLFYIAHFNAGLRIYDVSHARLPREVGWFMPPEPSERLGPMPEGSHFGQGVFWSGALPNRKEEWVLLLMTAFDEAVREHAVVRQVFGII